MTTDIELYEKTDRDLLVLLVGANNEQNQELKGINAHLKEANGTLLKHSNRLTALETQRPVVSYKRLSAVVAGITCGIGTGVYFLFKLISLFPTW